MTRIEDQIQRSMVQCPHGICDGSGWFTRCTWKTCRWAKSGEPEPSETGEFCCDECSILCQCEVDKRKAALQ